MSLLKHLEIITDHRNDINKKHDLIDVIFLTLAAVLSGADGWKSIQQFGDLQLEWLRQHRGFANGIPRRHCIATIIKALDTQVLLKAVFGWINDQRKQQGKQVIALDGKTMRGAWRDDASKALHVVSAFDVGNGVALYQGSSDSKGHEGDVARQVIAALTLDNAVVTLDALHCQADTMKAVIKGKGDFVIQLKGNQPTLSQHVKTCFAEQYENPELATFEQINRGHGREEKRTVMQMKAKLPKELKQKWPHVQTFIEVASERCVKNTTACSSRWYASSLPVNAEQAAGIVRDHWAVENQLHWVLDVVFREDELKIGDPTGATHLALFNRACLSLIRQHMGKKDSIAGKRRAALWSPEFRTELLFG
ncbi:ISAs1 family transposase [Alteromonas pelagimontana]|uniref:ISAs1 family transposase n=1 Tax=Alteromonas pelagimontana TaxID=1858656 RepID=A0A6M4MAK7_9ALTE|nr:ISAs1 family transposase [Alteromonas pelagimontana]QJR79700.1 ISAs1 family transposase [Alteromonas pelagimontana]QJR80919.1 ISAs1 family transposase [Alteromonas pelagimontana]